MSPSWRSKRTVSKFGSGFQIPGAAPGPCCGACCVAEGAGARGRPDGRHGPDQHDHAEGAPAPPSDSPRSIDKGYNTTSRPTTRGGQANETVTTAPRSGAFAAPTDPPPASAACLTIANPSPDPGIRRASSAR